MASCRELPTLNLAKPLDNPAIIRLTHVILKFPTILISRQKFIDIFPFTRPTDVDKNNPQNYDFVRSVFDNLHSQLGDKITGKAVVKQLIEAGFISTAEAVINNIEWSDLEAFKTNSIISNGNQTEDLQDENDALMGRGLNVKMDQDKFVVNFDADEKTSRMKYKIISENSICCRTATIQRFCIVKLFQICLIASVLTAGLMIGKHYLHPNKETQDPLINLHPPLEPNQSKKTCLCRETINSNPIFPLESPQILNSDESKEDKTTDTNVCSPPSKVRCIDPKRDECPFVNIPNPTPKSTAVLKNNAHVDHCYTSRTIAITKAYKESENFEYLFHKCSENVLNIEISVPVSLSTVYTFLNAFKCTLTLRFIGPNGMIVKDKIDYGFISKIIVSAAKLEFVNYDSNNIYNVINTVNLLTYDTYSCLKWIVLKCVDVSRKLAKELEFFTEKAPISRLGCKNREFCVNFPMPIEKRSYNYSASYYECNKF